MKNKIARFILKNHKELRDANETEILIKSASSSSLFAIRESKALGLSIKYISGKKIIERLPTGEIKILREIQDNPSTTKGLRKGMILCRR
jgi:hypothetical protein